MGHRSNWGDSTYVKGDPWLSIGGWFNPYPWNNAGQQTYNGQKPTFLTNNVMQLTFDLIRYGIRDGQVVVGGIFVYDTWEPAGPNALSLATLSYYQNFFNNQVELKFGYLNNLIENKFVA